MPPRCSSHGHGSPTHADIGRLLMDHARCPRLRSYWSFVGCGYRRTTGTCGSPHHQIGCPVTVLPSRKGSLAEAAIGLWLFVRDIMDGDIVGWLDDRLAGADVGCDDDRRAASMRASVLEPLIEIPGTGPKIWSMILAEALIGADLQRHRWVNTGASFVAVDSLLHAYLHRTGVLRRLGAEHPYGPHCYASGGCADVIAGLSRRVDARAFNPEFPSVFPRWVQFAVWQYCAEGGLAICNGSKIDDREPCDRRFCPAYQSCDHMGLRLPAGSTAAIFERRLSMTRF